MGLAHHPLDDPGQVLLLPFRAGDGPRRGFKLCSAEVSRGLKSDRGKGSTHPHAGSYLLNFPRRLPGNQVLRLKDISGHGPSQSPHTVTFGQGVTCDHSPD